MSTKPQQHVVEAFRRVLRPLVKVLIRRGVRFNEFCGIARRVYVESAIRDGVGLSGELTLARIAVATGLQKHEIETEVLQAAKMPELKPTIAAAISEVLHRWHTDMEYLGPYGLPMEMDLSGGSLRSFPDLVRSVDPTMDPEMMLEELLRAGVIVRSGSSQLKVLSRTFLVPEEMSPLLLEYFGSTVTSLTGTLEHNMDVNNARKLLQRSVFADRGLTTKQLNDFQIYAGSKVQDLMVDLDNWLADSLPKNRVRLDPVMDVGISVFQYVQSRELEEPLEGEYRRLPP